MNFSKEKIKDYYRCLKEQDELFKGKDVIYCFPQIVLDFDEITLIAQKFYGWTPVEVFNYYHNKIHKEIMISGSLSTTREDIEDFQDLIQLGLKALRLGITLD